MTSIRPSDRDACLKFPHSHSHPPLTVSSFTFPPSPACDLPRPSTCFDKNALPSFTASCHHNFGGTGLSILLPPHARINTATATTPSPFPPSTRLSQLYLLHLASDKLATHVRTRQLLAPSTRAIPRVSCCRPSPQRSTLKLIEGE
jgi:hypothetical protein